MVMVMVNVDLYSAIITKVSNALNTLVSGEKPGFQTLSEGLVVLLRSEVVRQRVPDKTRPDLTQHETRSAYDSVSNTSLRDANCETIADIDIFPRLLMCALPHC